LLSLDNKLEVAVDEEVDRGASVDDGVGDND